MGGQILPYYLRVFSVFLITSLILIFISFYYILNKNIKFSNPIFKIEKGENIELFINKNITNISDIEIYFIKFYYKINNLFFYKIIHYGEFYIHKNISSIELLINGTV